MAIQKAMISSKTNEWETPQVLFDKLNKEFNFDLDVSANEKNKKCPVYFDISKDGLKQRWHNLSSSACWMNPPYGGQTGKWIKKAYRESLRGVVVVCLIVSSTDRSYWHDYIFPYADEIRFIRGRLRFGIAKSTAPFASAIIVFRGKTQNRKIIFYSNHNEFQKVLPF